MADQDFDRIVLDQWKVHIGSLPRNLARSKGWGSEYLKRWYRKVRIDDDNSPKGQGY